MAVIVAPVTLPTATVVAVKFAVVAPASTVTLTGTVAAPLSLESVTTDPPVGAAEDRVTVPVEEVPPVTLVGLRVTFDTAGGLTVRVVV
jgi:hypothetical protein